jgi:hypothetical protein
VLLCESFPVEEVLVGLGGGGVCWRHETHVKNTSPVIGKGGNDSDIDLIHLHLWGLTPLSALLTSVVTLLQITNSLLVFGKQDLKEGSHHLVIQLVLLGLATVIRRFQSRTAVDLKKVTVAEGITKDIQSNELIVRRRDLLGEEGAGSNDEVRPNR